jgi:hypothetical protein
MPEAVNEYRLGTPNPVMMFELSVTSWCNYRCTYCVTTVHPHRPESFHAFDFHPVDSWITAFQRVPHDFSLLCRGGEPFLDHENFARFLAGVGALSRLRYIRVDTNGSWDTELYDSVPLEIRKNVQLNVSFHPTQIKFAQFKKRLRRIIDAGWQVGMINYVMEANQAGDYEEVRDYVRREHGIYVNPNPDAFDDAWASQVPEVKREARRTLSTLLPVPDVMRKTGDPTKGKPCFFPSIAYFIAPNGLAERACGVKAPGESPRLDFIRSSAQVRPLPSRVSCPLRACLCLDRYAFLGELDGRGESLNLLAEYVRDCTAHQEASRDAGSNARGVWAFLASLLSPGRKAETTAAAPPRRRLAVVQKERGEP